MRLLAPSTNIVLLTFYSSINIDDFINNREVDTVDISTLQRVAYGGQAVSATEKNRIAEKIGCEVLQFYGGTESGLLTFLGLKSTVPEMPICSVRRGKHLPNWEPLYKFGILTATNPWNPGKSDE